jgi:hypothetical protein
MRMRITASLCTVDSLPWNSFPLLAEYINKHSLDPALIFYCGFEHAACQLVGTRRKYFLVWSKGSNTEERIHDGRTWEM